MEALGSADIEALLGSEHMPGLEMLEGLEGLGLAQQQQQQQKQSLQVEAHPSLQGAALAGAPLDPLLGSQLSGLTGPSQPVSLWSNSAWGFQQESGAVGAWLHANEQGSVIPPGQPSVHQGPQQAQRGRGGGWGRGRGRGRQAQDPEVLTEKQLRVREANRRFEEKRKAQMREAEQSLDAMSAELQRERAQHESAQHAGQVYRQMLGYKDAVLSTLQLSEELDPQPSLTIAPEMLETIRQHKVVEGFGAEALARYAVGGHIGHLSENGSVSHAPPFEAVAKDWGDIVAGLRAVLREACITGGSNSSSAQSSSGTLGSAGKQAQQAQQAQQQQAGLARSSAPGEVVELFSRGSGSSGTLSAAMSTEGGHQSAPAAAAGPSDACCTGSGPGTLGLGSSTVMEGPETPGTDFRGVSLRDGVGSGTAVQPTSAKNLTRAGSQVPKWAPGGSKAAIELAPLTCASGKDIDWEVLDKGLELQDGRDLYHFTGPHLRQVEALMRRVGTVAWQQAIFFPDNANKMVALRMDTCKEGQEGLPRWQRVLRELRLRPEQLEVLATLHRNYMETVKPSLVQRREALQRLRQLRDEVGIGASQFDITRRSLELSNCNTALTRSVHTLNAATAAMSSGLFGLMDFPLQEAKLVTLSWPWYPAVHLLGVAAAMELGLDMEVYTRFSELYDDEDHGGTDSAGERGAAGEGSGLG